MVANAVRPGPESPGTRRPLPRGDAYQPAMTPAASRGCPSAGKPLPGALPGTRGSGETLLGVRVSRPLPVVCWSERGPRSRRQDLPGKGHRLLAQRPGKEAVCPGGAGGPHSLSPAPWLRARSLWPPCRIKIARRLDAVLPASCQLLRVGAGVYGVKGGGGSQRAPPSRVQAWVMSWAAARLLPVQPGRPRGQGWGPTSTRVRSSRGDVDTGPSPSEVCGEKGLQRRSALAQAPGSWPA